MKEISEFRIVGLFGNRDVTLPLKQNRLILVGPNGLGKSSVINIFYLFVSRQWLRLLEYDFREIIIVVGEQKILAQRDEIKSFMELSKLINEVSPTGTHINDLTKRLVESGNLAKFISLDSIPQREHKTFSEILRVSTKEVPMFHKFLQRRLPSDITSFKTVREDLPKLVAQSFSNRVLFLPTYRRIEKDLSEVFPDFEERLKKYSGSSSNRDAPKPRLGRSSSHYVELVSFGMEDVRANLANRLSEIRNYSLAQYNNLSAIYLRDVIHGRADHFVAEEINELTDKDISDILTRVSETALSPEDKTLLRDKVRGIQGKASSDVPINDRYLAHYFARLVSAQADITKQERDISSFITVCNEYLLPSKAMKYDEITFSVKIEDELGRELDLSVLSSGEKQIVSIFAHLYLEENDKQIVIIDEPELSLSVPWQKKFLPDIINSGKCGLLMAVTHSPFIYSNELRKNSVDLRKMSKLHVHE